MKNKQSLDQSQRRQLAVDYMGTVRRMAYGMARTLPKSVSLDDLIGAGMLGLADALAKYTGHDLTEFGAYVGWRVRGAMIDELRTEDPLTRPQRRFATNMAATVRRLRGELGRSPEETEIAEGMGLPIALFREQAQTASFQGSTRLDTVCGTGVDGIQFQDNSHQAADLHLIQVEQRDRLVVALAELPERLRTVVRLYYEQDYSLREIGEAIGVTESRVCQLHREAINRLRAASNLDVAKEGAAVKLASGWV